MTDEQKQFYQKFNLFPVIRTSQRKTPALPKGESYMNPKFQIRDISGLNGHKSYGIICNAESGIMVMDVDNKEKPPEESLKDLFQAAKMTNDQIEVIRNTLTVKTPNGGYHFYFKFREGLRSTQGEIGQFIDFRTDPPDNKDPGYIMGPYSRIRAKDGQEKEYLPIRGDTIQPMPETLYQFIKNVRKTKTNRTQRGPTPSSDDEDPFQALKGMKDGDGRNAAFNTILFNYCKKRNIRELAVMESIAEKVQSEYFSEPEPGLMKTVESVHQALSEEPEYNNYLYFENGKQRLNTAYLAEYIAHNSNYLLARESHSGAEIFYWFMDGYYKKLSNNEIKGKIKEYIPLEIRKASMMDEVFKQLITNKGSVPIEDLNKIDDYINFRNGLYNIKTGKLEEHSPKVLSTIQLNADYNPSAAYPSLWEWYLDFLTNNDRDMKAVLQEWTGLTISNLPGFKPKKALALYGPNGNNGKTVFLNILDYLIGRANTASRNIQDLSKPFGVSDLYGKKALIIDDQKDTDFTDSSIFKSITSGGAVNCEFKGMNSFNYQFRGTVTFGCNELPYLTGEKGSHIFERLIIIPCENVVPENERDPMLFENLLDEMDGIILWALEGLERLKSTNYQFTPASAIQIANNEYRAKSDSLYRYVMDTYEMTGDQKDRILKTEFEDGYEYWATRNDIPTPIHKKNIESRAAKIGIRFKKSSGRYYTGLREKPELTPYDGDDVPF